MGSYERNFYQVIKPLYVLHKILIVHISDEYVKKVAHFSSNKNQMFEAFNEFKSRINMKNIKSIINFRAYL